ncbi:MFS phospholipid transporter-like protein Git1 [Saccharata proteae CBS 121410]|uniref:MFS phospholipid transporter-like protein Git1 n=1 Tax=Saccharata proteae CBS 121410 TaxID=1314787 RepID=A0A9P4HYG8_9PEZI|nr:MFS phospholipid transporter-like protein Git1 [Saccharata proteae CBS 121410]
MDGGATKENQPTAAVVNSDETSHSPSPAAQHVPLEATDKSRWDRMWPVIACGAGLFSDGYLNNVIGSVNTMLKKIYGDEYANSPAQSNVSSITFAGTVVGMLVFGYTSDHYSRKWSLFVSTIIILVFAALGAGSYGAGGSIGGLFAALTAYRFFLGIGIGGEYPAGSVGCAESTGELKSGTRNRWFVLFTNFQIDFGFVVAAIVPLIVVLATTESHLRAAWRICLGIGVIPPLSLLYLRIKLKEPEAFKRESMRDTKTPYWLILKYYWFRLSAVSLVWWIYDFSSYAFSIYSSTIIANLLGDNYPLWKSFAWNILINFFYIPGAFLGAYLADVPWLGPKRTLVLGVVLQSVVGYIMAGCYAELSKPENIAAFCVVYGIFLSLGEMGPGDNIGLMASKTSATAIRGEYYGIAAASGKVGAFVGTYVFPIIQNNASSDVAAGQNPFWIASSLAILSGVIAFFCLPTVGQDTIDEEDVRFREYLESQGYDTSLMGLKSHDSQSSIEAGEAAEPTGKEA